MKQVLLNWHPWRDNPLDHIGDTLRTPDGTPVALTRLGMDFVITVNGKEVLRTRDNSDTCGWLYAHEVYQVLP